MAAETSGSWTRSLCEAYATRVADCSVKHFLQKINGLLLGPPKTLLNRIRHHNRQNRKLEIGPGKDRIKSFETLNIVAGWNVDYVCDAARRLPFGDGTFEVIYASHILEHVPWYQTDNILREWVRTLARGGQLEIWVPNGLRICQALVDAEVHGKNYIHEDGWYRFNDEKDPCKWAAGRIFTYGDGSGRTDHPNWHRALFTPRYLRELLTRAGLVEVRELKREEIRAYDHGWINLGMTGKKP